MRLPLLFLSLLVLAGAAPAQGTTLVERSYRVGKTERVALVAAPATTGGAKVPVLFAFHGHGGSMYQAARSFNYHRLWPEALVVYLQGLPTPGHLSDPDGARNGWQKTVGDQQDRDLKFFDTVLAALKKQYPVDEKRVFATGHSNGGAFTYLLAAERGTQLAAIAPSGAPAARSLPRLRAKPTLHVAGRADPLVRFPWQENTMNTLRQRNGCDEQGRAWAKSGDLTGILYPSRQGTPFVSLLHPGGHEFPTGAAALIVKFFREVPFAPTPRQVTSP